MFAFESSHRLSSVPETCVQAVHMEDVCCLLYTATLVTSIHSAVTGTELNAVRQLTPRPLQTYLHEL